MTEEEWLECEDWRGLFDVIEGKVSDRKLRLFAASCCRDAWSLLTKEGRSAVEVSERYAEGRVTREQLQAAREVFRAPDNVSPVEVIGGRRYRPDVGGSAADENPLWAARAAMRQSADAKAWHLMRNYRREMFADEAHRLLGEAMAGYRRLLHDVVGPAPFRPVAAPPPSLTPDVVSLARAAYEVRALPSGRLEPARCAVLADALEEAGCYNGDLLSHLRGPGPHVRGCWALDLILGKT